jgi:hypothetical protein
MSSMQYAAGTDWTNRECCLSITSEPAEHHGASDAHDGFVHVYCRCLWSKQVPHVAHMT